MEELIALVVQVLWEIAAVILEASLDGAASWIFEIFAELFSDVFLKQAREGTLRFLALVTGCAGGRISVIWIDHTLLHHGWQRLASLALAPLLAGWFVWALAKHVRRGPYKDEPVNHFWRAFLLTLGYVLVRFAFARRW